MLAAPSSFPPAGGCASAETPERSHSIGTGRGGPWHLVRVAKMAERYLGGDRGGEKDLSTSHSSVGDRRWWCQGQGGQDRSLADSCCQVMWQSGETEARCGKELRVWRGKNRSPAPPQPPQTNSSTHRAETHGHHEGTWRSWAEICPLRPPRHRTHVGMLRGGTGSRCKSQPLSEAAINIRSPSEKGPEVELFRFSSKSRRRRGGMGGGHSTDHTAKRPRGEGQNWGVGCVGGGHGPAPREQPAAAERGRRPQEPKRSLRAQGGGSPQGAPAAPQARGGPKAGGPGAGGGPQ